MLIRNQNEDILVNLENIVAIQCHKDGSIYAHSINHSFEIAKYETERMAKKVLDDFYTGCHMHYAYQMP